MSEILRTGWWTPERRKGLVAVGFVVTFAAGVWVGGPGDPQPVEPGAQAEGKQEATVYTCSMHPQIRSPDPGLCPQCGMDLIPVSNSADQQANPDRVTLSEHAKILARIRTAKVKRREDTARRLRLLGRVDYDETRTRTITPWIAGRIERLHVSITGQRVYRGQAIATLYSPELYSAQQDLIEARKQLARLGESNAEYARSAAAAALDSARQRIRLLGVGDEQLATMEKAERPSRHATITSPFSGTVIERLVDDGDYVQAGTGMFRVADLSRLWVQLDAYETDLADLSVGQEVSLTVTALPQEIFAGRVAFIDPVLNAQTRTTRVRVEVGNRSGDLRPGMFGEATVESAPKNEGLAPLVIPHSAALFSGRRSVVYVEVPDQERPTYEAREVRLGTRNGSYFPVIAGLAEGDRVVIHGAFTLDADLQIRGGRSLMTRSDDTEPGRFDRIVDLSPRVRAAFAPLAEAYLAIQVGLAADDLEGARGAAKTLARAAGSFSGDLPGVARSLWKELQGSLRAKAEVLVGAGDIAETRVAFEPLTAAVVELFERFGNPTAETIAVAHCPMAFDGRGASWLQVKGTLANPYFGASMLTCGTTRTSVPAGTYLAHGHLDDEDTP